jgi:hypothetical protein
MRYGLVGLIGAAQRKQRLVHIGRSLAHTVVADGHGELLGLLLKIEPDHEILAHLID